MLHLHTNTEITKLMEQTPGRCSNVLTIELRYFMENTYLVGAYLYLQAHLISQERRTVVTDRKKHNSNVAKTKYKIYFDE